ncbi:hypothetical protein RUM44_003669 [Polyplax serrata]|uniref:HEAT repeat-containing protein 1 n=1 Tax=Polyplax serrata TaxID=468196 RepID=A0ABR1AH45_POLSC
MATSLAEQLRKLALPESSLETDKRKRISLLFDPAEAAKLDKDAFFEIGLDGLKGLVSLEPAFESFTETLFDLSSRFLSRTVESKEINKKLDKNIQKFLRLLSPYLLLKQSHKALEWLIYRYQIHSFNIDDLLALILPYHETKIFVKILQLINLNAPNAAQWKWLAKLKAEGVHLPKSVVINHALSDSSFLRFICDNTLKTISENKKHDCAEKLGTLMTFYASIVANVFSKKEFSNHHMTIVLPSLVKALTSDLKDFRAAGYITAGQLVSCNQVEKDLIDKLLELILNEENDMQNERILLLLLIFQTQSPAPKFPPNSIGKLSAFTNEIIKLAGTGVQVGPLVLQIVDTCLESILNSESDIVDAQILCYTIATEIKCDLEHCKTLICLIDSAYNELSDKMKNDKNEGEDSGILRWMKELILSAIDKHNAILEKDKTDDKYIELREKWKSPEELTLQESALLDLMKKCQGEHRESAWLQLRPLLLHRIRNPNVFEALCKVAPFYDNLVLLLCLNKLLHLKNTETDKAAILNKISKSRFGENNPHIMEIHKLSTKKSKGGMVEKLETYFFKQQKESDNAIEFEPWLAALQELKQMDFISDGSETWCFSLRVLLVTLPEKFNATYVLRLMSLLSTLKKSKLKIKFEILGSIIKYLGTNKKKFTWYDLSTRDSEIWLKVRILEYLLEGLYNDESFQDDYNAMLNEFSVTCFSSQQELVRLLGAVCYGTPRNIDNKSEFKVSPTLQIYALHKCWKQLKSEDESVSNAFKPELTVIVCYLLITLNNESAAVRQACLHVLDALSALLSGNSKAYPEVALLEKLRRRFEEISLDCNQVNVALYCSLSPSESVQATLPQSLANYLSATRSRIFGIITAEDTPLYISLKLLQLLDNVNSSEIIEQLIDLNLRCLRTSKESEQSRMVLANFWSRVNETTSEVFQKQIIWELVTKSIKHEKCDGLSPAVSFLKCITREVFDKLPPTRKFQLVECMVETRSETESPVVSSTIASVMKKIFLDCKIILPMINQMSSLFNLPQKRRESARNSKGHEQPVVIERKEWKNGISLLELIQSKKRLVNSNVLIQPLFDVLKICLDQEEQTTFEYAKQLVLGCLLDCCKKLSTEKEDVNENNLNVELVVHCLRASPNPQTHHHALMLLSYLSAVIPKQVIHNVMAIFTFMGTSVARMDDEHSVKVVTQVVEAVVPVLVKAISTEHEDLQTVTAEILRVFVWAVKDIPQHRRKPLLLQLLITLQPENCLWIFLLLLLENHVQQGDANKLDGSAMPMSHCLGLQLCLSASPKIVLQSVVKIINYLISIPMEYMNKEGRAEKVQGRSVNKKSDGLFDMDSHTPKQLRHFCYTVLTFLNTLLADNNFIVQVAEQTSSQETILEEALKETIAAVMKYTPIVKKQLDKLQTKFWKAMTHQCYEIVDKFVLLVPNEMLLSIIKKLLNHPMRSLRRKALDLLNSLLQQDHQDFSKDEKTCLIALLNPIVEIINSIGNDGKQQELLLQQTALLTLKLLVKVLCSEHVETFKKVLIDICEILKSNKVEGPLMGSVMLAIAELVTSLKAHSVSELPVFMPLMLKEFSKNSSPTRFNELGLNSITLAIHRVVDVMPNFLSPYLDSILFSVCTVSVRALDKPDLSKKLSQIRQKLGANVEHRILIPAIRRSYTKLIESEEYESTAPLFATLSSSFAAFPDVSKIVPEISQLFISALSFRSDCDVESKDVELGDIDKVEQNVIDALVPFVLKLSESLFKPLYYQIFHWASEHKDRAITFFRLSHALAESLKGLFVLFAGHFLQKAANLLDATNLSKTEEDYFGNSTKGVTKSIALLESILKTLHSVFLYDSTESSNFLNKDKFEVLLHPLVDQLENPLGGIEELEKRTSTLLTPCLAQMALATDDTLWKSLNYQVLVKTKSILPQIRIGALETIVAIASKLGEDYLMLLPETIGSLAELLEDENEKVETAMKNAIQRMEDVLGQPIREYFQ